MKKVSIILPCYNVEQFLAKSIQSVLTQTYTDFELLVVIDGSPDKSKQIADKFAETDSRIKVFEKENGGLSDARNYGLERAKGEFVYFMDSDDWVEPNLLEDNLKIVEEENLDFVVFGYIQDNEDISGNVLNSVRVFPKVEKYRKGDKDLNIDSYHLGLLGYAWNKLYRRSFIVHNNLRFQKGISLVEDILYNSEIYAISDIICFNTESYYHYINRPSPTLVKKFHKNAFDLIILRNNAIKQFLEAWHYPLNKSFELLANNFIVGLRYCLNNIFQSENLSLSSQIKNIKNIYNDDATKSHVIGYTPTTKLEKLLKYLIKNKLVILTYLFYKLKKNA